MLEQFRNHLSTHFPFLTGKKLLLAVSGGLDSMVLLHLFQQMENEITVLHCNFQLRGIESYDDQAFIQEYTSQNTIPFSSHNLIPKLLLRITNYLLKLRLANCDTVGFTNNSKF